MTATPGTVETKDDFSQLFTLSIANDTVIGSVYREDLTLEGVFSSLSLGEINNTNQTVTAKVYGDLNSKGIGTITIKEDKLQNRTTPLSADVIVVEKPTYSIRYDSNGATSGNVPTDNNSYEEGDNIIVKGNTGKLIKIGYTFTGWNTNSNGTGVSYSEGDPYKVNNSNVTLYAEWTTKPYTVTFKDSDGTVLKETTVGDNKTINEPTVPTKEGYTFEGWYEDETLIKFFDFDTPIVKDMVLYGKWEKIHKNNGSGSGKNHGNNKNIEQQKTIVIVNGQKEKAGEEKVKEEAGKKVVEVKVDSKAVHKKIEEIVKNKEQETEAQSNNIVEIPIATQNADTINTTLRGDIIKKMGDYDFDLSIKTDDINYIVSSKEIGIENIAKKLGVAQDHLQEIEVAVQMDKVDKELAKKIEENAKVNNYEIIFPPIDFEVTAKIKDSQRKKVKITRFKQYVQRVIKIPEDIDPSKITTGIIYNEDGTFAHIPTEVYEEDGIYYAKLSSLTNSSYSIIWNPITVTSVENHWSKKYVNDMASRLIIKRPETFVPDENITRGEFAEYITKALGIYRTGVAKSGEFTDVKISDELADAIAIATEYGIIKGYPDKTFRSDLEITREEAMVMYRNAMDIVKLKERDNNRIENYKDTQEIEDWAYDSIKKVVSVGVFNGKTSETINPKDMFTYAEAATAIRNLLIESGLINK